MGPDCMDGIYINAFMELDYGLFDSTADELLTSYGWSNLNISLLWFYFPAYY